MGRRSEIANWAGVNVQRLLFAKVEVWFLVLLAAFGLSLTVFFGWLVLSAAQDKGRLSPLRQTVIQIAEVPDTLKQLFSEDNRIQAPSAARFKDMSPGWNVAGGGPMPTIPGYLLLSRYDGDRTQHVTELVSMTTWQVLHSWIPDAETLLKDASRDSEFVNYDSWDNAHFRAISPILLENGDLITKDHASPLFRIDGCAQRVWMLDGKMFHHSNELAADGTIWASSRAEPQVIDRVNPHYYDDEIAQISLDGKLLFSRSVTQILLDHGWAHRLFTNGTYINDPIHLNDVEPVLTDGPYWKRGDLFLSLRNLSAIMLYRPSTDEILWMKEGPWIAQHDVDVLDDHRISVYNNNAQDRGTGEYVDTNSDVKIYDFATDTVTDFLNDGMANAGVKTLYAGLYTALPGGYSLIEDVTNARLLVFAPDGTLSAEYANKAATGKVYHLGWSRYITPALGDAAVAALGTQTCGK